MYVGLYCFCLTYIIQTYLSYFILLYLYRMKKFIAFSMYVKNAIYIYIMYVKGTHTVYFSNSLYIINQKPMIPRTHFHCITT